MGEARIRSPVHCKADDKWAQENACQVQMTVGDVICLPDPAGIMGPISPISKSFQLGLPSVQCILGFGSLLELVPIDGTNVATQTGRRNPDQIIRQYARFKVIQVVPPDAQQVADTQAYATHSRIGLQHSFCTSQVVGRTFELDLLGHVNWLPGYCGCKSPLEDFQACPRCPLGRRCNSSPKTASNACCCGTISKPCSCPDGYTAPLLGCNKPCNNPTLVTQCNNAGTCEAGDGYSNTQGTGVPFAGCECIPGHFGWDCALTCDPPCASTAQCILASNVNARPTCLCTADGLGSACESMSATCGTGLLELCSGRGVCR